MPSRIKIVGTPRKIRKTKYNNTELVCLDFVEGGKSSQPKGLPKPTETCTTVLLNNKQWKKLDFQKEERLLIDGVVTFDVPSSLVKGDFGVVCYSAQKI